MTENGENLGNNTRLYKLLALQYDVKMTLFRFLSYDELIKVLSNPLDVGVA